MFLKNIKTLLAFVICFITFSCSSAPRFTSEKDIVADDKAVIGEQTVADSDTGHTTFNDISVLETVTGIASYYADAFNGKITYSGEVYNMYGISAAHPTYPMGTVLRITNLNNGKTVMLKVNDRMPYNPDRIIDLSLGAAQKLDMVHDGLAKVKIEVLKFGEGKK